MEKQDEGRWFLIEHHKGCSSVFTVNHKEFKASHDYEHPLPCPTCNKKIASGTVKHLIEFFQKYDELIKQLENEGFKIRQIKTNIDPEKLEILDILLPLIRKCT